MSLLIIYIAFFAFRAKVQTTAQMTINVLQRTMAKVLKTRMAATSKHMF
jgi:hypothetical protein